MNYTSIEEIREFVFCAVVAGDESDVDRHLAALDYAEEVSQAIEAGWPWEMPE